MKTFTIENISDLTLFSTFEREVSVLSKISFITGQLVELNKNAYVVNYLAYCYSYFISVVTTFIFILDFNIVLISEKKKRIREKK